MIGSVLAQTVKMVIAGGASPASGCGLPGGSVRGIVLPQSRVPRCRRDGDRASAQPSGTICGKLGRGHRLLAEVDGIRAGQQPPRSEGGVQQHKAGRAGLGAGRASIGDRWPGFGDAAVVQGAARAGAQQFLMVVPQWPENPGHGTSADAQPCRLGLRRVSGRHGLAVCPPRQPGPPAGRRPQWHATTGAPRGLYPIPPGSRHRRKPEAAGASIPEAAATRE